MLIINSTTDQLIYLVGQIREATNIINDLGNAYMGPPPRPPVPPEPAHIKEVEPVHNLTALVKDLERGVVDLHVAISRFQVEGPKDMMGARITNVASR